MTKEFFDTHYGHLSDKADAIQVFGKRIGPGGATVGKIRRKLEGHAKTATVSPESDGSGLCITELQRKAFAS
ncbi:MAG TPA: hypothetical protein VJT08_09340 [Terriglobales bacterium]|nr:hypothetical protein [Acidobacteriaceae bacterium]HKR30670.1 hypothetical protein [Terriglobales bacterium]